MVVRFHCLGSPTPRGELSRWIGPRPWQVPSTDSTIVPLLEFEVLGTSSTVRPQEWIFPLKIYDLEQLRIPIMGDSVTMCSYGTHPEADRVPIQTCTAGLLPNVSVTLTNNGILGWLAAATI